MLLLAVHLSIFRMFAWWTPLKSFQYWTVDLFCISAPAKHFGHLTNWTSYLVHYISLIRARLLDLILITRMFSFWPWRWYEVSTFPLHEIFGPLFLWETILGLLVASWLQFADHCQWCSFDLVCWLLADLVWCSCRSFAQNSVNNNISKIQLINWRREERK